MADGDSNSTDAAASALDPYRDSLISPFSYWLTALSMEQQSPIIEQIVSAFEDWRDGQADADGNVRFSEGRGLLGMFTPPTVKPAGDVEPWQCGGPLVNNDVDLAFKLWLDNDPGFERVLQAHGLERVFALIGLWSARTAARNSLIRLNGLLVHSLMRELALAHKIGKELFDEHKARDRKQKESIAKARAAGAEQRKQKGEQVKNQYWTAACDYAAWHPAARKDDVIAFLQTLGLPKRSTATIERLIAGALDVGRDAARARRDGLYATSHTRNR